MDYGKEFAAEASWRAAWDPDNKDLEYDGKAVFYNRKHPLYQRWVHQRERSQNAALSCLLIGPQHGPIPSPAIKNPYIRPARAFRRIFDSEEEDDLLTSHVKAEFKTVHITQDDTLKTYEQKLFEAFQEDGDAHGKLNIDLVRDILLNLCIVCTREQICDLYNGVEELTFHQFTEAKHHFSNPDDVLDCFLPMPNFSKIDDNVVDLLFCILGDEPLQYEEVEIIKNIAKENSSPEEFIDAILKFENLSNLELPDGRELPPIESI